MSNKPENDDYRLPSEVQDENTELMIEAGHDVILHDALTEARTKEIEDYYEDIAEEEGNCSTSSVNENSILENDENEDRETEEQMAEHQHAVSESYEYLVRGAILRCTCGSHCRRLNLPESHNYYMNGRDLMNMNDSLPGTKEICESEDCNKINIPYFGVCEHGKSPGKTVLLVKDKQRDPFGNEVAEEEKKENFWNRKNEDNVKGPVCIPKILSRWMCPDEYCLVDGVASIKTDSFLVCAYGGIIEALQSGQSLDDNIVEL